VPLRGCGVHVKVQNQSTGGRDYFIHFTAPNSTGGISVPTYIGGPSGNQPFNVNQKKYAKSDPQSTS